MLDPTSAADAPPATSAPPCRSERNVVDRYLQACDSCCRRAQTVGGARVAAPRKHMLMLATSKAEAILAVRLYNDPYEPRAFEGFVLHMHVAWLYLLHAEFTNSKIDFRYHQRDHPRLLDKVDGEAKHWELAKCVRERWPDRQDPTRANLDFFTRLRNKIEHRYPRLQQEMQQVFAGEAQALLLNYEQEVTYQFGHDQSLAGKLRIPLFVGSFSAAGERSLKVLRDRLPVALRRFHADFVNDLDPATRVDVRFVRRLQVANTVGGPASAPALQFLHDRGLTDEERDALASSRAVGDGGSGMVITKVKQQDVSNSGKLKPTDAARQVAAGIPFMFTAHDFTLAWRTLGVRPAGGAKDPCDTITKYCTYDALHHDYCYTQAYVKKLIRDCQTPEGFQKALGRAARDKKGNPVTDQMTFSQSA